MNTSTKAPFTILLTDDGSEHAQAAIQLICDLPCFPSSAITALSVFTPRQIDLHLALQANLEQTKKLLEEKGCQVVTELKAGSPAETIVEFAENMHPNLIVMGAKGLRSTLSILLGGVAQQVVEYGCCPVLVVRAPYLGLKRVLFVTDGSESSKRAAEYITRLPLPKEIHLQVMHVLPPFPSPQLITQVFPMGAEPLPVMPVLPSSEESAAWKEQEEEKGNLLLKNTIETLKSSGLAAEPVLARGDAATEIISHASHDKTDLIVSGSRGLSTMRSWLLGSVSRKLLHYAGCSVLVVKTLPMDK